MPAQQCADATAHDFHEWYEGNILRHECAGICGHCLGPVRGWSTVHGTPLCHPNGGLDCYRLVTVYGHALDCASCRVDSVVRLHNEAYHPGQDCPTEDEDGACAIRTEKPVVLTWTDRGVLRS